MRACTGTDCLADWYARQALKEVYSMLMEESVK
jgi:hypothetical protein